MYGHLPVLLNEVVSFLDPRPGQHFIDATLGAGGHTRALLEATSPDGRVLALDMDSSTLDRARLELQSFGSRLMLVHANFKDIAAVAASSAEQRFLMSDGILADIGISSMMVDDPERGFSFMRGGPLDMRMDRSQALTASDIVNTASERDLADIIFNYGEERRSRPIARSIVRSRPLSTTTDLASAVSRVLGGPRYGKIHPSTRTFQALRIAVNGELDSLKDFLNAAPQCLKPGGRLGVITFHSLEDRIVKNAFRALPGGKVLTKKVVTASESELESNPRSRSAKLRVWEKSHGD